MNQCNSGIETELSARLWGMHRDNETDGSEMSQLFQEMIMCEILGKTIGCIQKFLFVRADGGCLRRVVNRIMI